MWIFTEVIVASALCLVSHQSAEHDVQYINIFCDDFVILECSQNLTFDKQWLHGERVLFYNKAALEANLDTRIMLLDNNSLFINEISISDEGFYDCIEGTNIFTSYFLNVLSKSYFSS